MHMEKSQVNWSYYLVIQVWRMHHHDQQPLRAPWTSRISGCVPDLLNPNLHCDKTSSWLACMLSGSSPGAGHRKTERLAKKKKKKRVKIKTEFPAFDRHKPARKQEDGRLNYLWRSLGFSLFLCPLQKRLCLTAQGWEDCQGFQCICPHSFLIDSICARALLDQCVFIPTIFFFFKAHSFSPSITDSERSAASG